MYLNYASHHPIKKYVADNLIKSGFNYYNPSDSGNLGEANKHIIERCKEAIAEELDFDLDDYEIIFTSGATEANQLVLSNCNGKTVLTTPIEHSSILKYPHVNLEFASVYRMTGTIIENDEFMKHLKESDLFSFNLLNNETGNVNSFSHLTKLAHLYGTPVHIDATQAVGRVDFSLSDFSPDYVTISGHKFGALSGIGALIIRRSRLTYFEPLLYGSQNNSYRGGTENMIGVHSMLLALDDCVELHFREKSIKLLDDFKYNLYLNNVNYTVNTADYDCGIWSITFPQINAKVLRDVLDEVYDIQVSTGSACLAGERSYVLETLGWDTDHTIRISFGADGFDATYLAKCIKEVIDKYGD